MDVFRTAEAQALHTAMMDARRALEEASEQYQYALAAAMDADAGADAMATLRHEGRAFAQALARYSTAAMAWLSYVDAQLRPKKADSAG